MTCSLISYPRETLDVRHRGCFLLAGALLCAALPGALRAQGGWRQWDVYLRDGTRVEANPLGSPDDAHIAISVGGVTGHDTTIARTRIAYIAAQAPAESLPPAPSGNACADVVVRRDGRRTTGHVTLVRVEYSEGTVVQRGDSIDLREVAYLVFARPCGAHPPRRFGSASVRRFHFLDVTHRPVDWFSRVAVRHFSTIDEYYQQVTDAGRRRETFNACGRTASKTHPGRRFTDQPTG